MEAPTYVLVLDTYVKKIPNATSKLERHCESVVDRIKIELNLALRAPTELRHRRSRSLTSRQTTIYSTVHNINSR